MQQNNKVSKLQLKLNSTRANVTLSGILGPYKPGRPRNEMQNEGTSKAGLGNFGHISWEMLRFEMFSFNRLRKFNFYSQTFILEPRNAKSETIYQCEAGRLQYGELNKLIGSS